MAPHASPSVAPPDSRPTKRPRLSKSTHRVLNVWAQLAERYNKRLDEDDIVDLYSGTIISDRGVLKNGKDYDFGHFASDDSQDDPDQEQEQEQEPGEQDQDDDVDELDTLPVRRAPDGTMASTSELLRAVPPLSATTDADDLNDFLEVEKRRRELLGDEDGDDDLSAEELAALREALHESEEAEEQPETVDPETIEDESEDELNSIWQHDEASAVYHIPRNESEQDSAEGEQKVLEFADSDEEFAALLERPPQAGKRKRNSSPSFSLRGSSPSSHRYTSSESTLGNVATFIVCTIAYQRSTSQYLIHLRLQQAPVSRLVRRRLKSTPLPPPPLIPPNHHRGLKSTLSPSPPLIPLNHHRGLKFTLLPPPPSIPLNHHNSFSTRRCTNYHMLCPPQCRHMAHLECLRHRQARGVCTPWVLRILGGHKGRPKHRTLLSWTIMYMTMDGQTMEVHSWTMMVVH